MAHSSPVNTAQAIKLCELCEAGSIKWRCVNCDKRMCEICKTAHTRVPVTAKHQIVTITTPLQDMPRKIIMDNIPCKDHATRMTCVFCQTCDRLVCQDCVSTNHSRHKFLPLETSVDKKLDQLRSFQDKIFEDLKYCESKNIEIQKLKPKYYSIFEESIEKIRQKEKELIEAVGNYSKELQRKVETERSKAEDAIFKIEKHIDQVKKGLEKQREEIQNALKSTQGSVIFETKPATQKLDITFDSLPKKVEGFLPKAEQETQIPGWFGSLQKIKVHLKEPMDLIKIFTIPIELQRIDNLLVQNETSAWIESFKDEMIQKIDIAENEITTSQSVSCPIHDMDFTADNDILYTDYINLDVKLLSQSGKIKSFLSVKPLNPRGIRVTRDYKVLIGVKESCTGDAYRVTKESQRAVMVFDVNGTQLQSYQFDKNGKRLFTIPYRIQTNINQDILVIDRTSVYTGRVVCLDKDGNLKYIYEGNTKIKATKEFDPRDLAITSVGYIIVCDCSNHALYALSERGDLLFYKVMEDLGILCPLSIDFDRKGLLLVGGGIVSKETCAKLHKVKFVW